MRRLWIADVHANLPAFEAVLNDAGAVDEVVFAGDVVGFGPHPAECVDLLMSLQPRAVLGNHDAAVLARASQPDADDWDTWAWRRLGEARREFLTALPVELELDALGQTATVTHQLPGAPYLHPAMPDDVLAPYCLGLGQPLTICGHSHRALDRTIEERRLVILPSVGQPRNGDPRAGYAVENDGQLSFRFVAYDIERTVADLLSLGLPEPFASRWISFVRTARDPEWSREYDGRHVP